MVGVQGFDVGAHFGDPGGDKRGRAGGGAGKVAHAVGAAARLVGEFPGRNCGGGFVTGDDGGDVALECVFDFGYAVELAVSLVS
jgi:hypothetical protein